MFCFFRSIIVVTTQFMSPALHKNFSEADFDFKVCMYRVCVQDALHVSPYVSDSSNLQLH